MSSLFSSVNADTISIDRSNYTFGDVIKISGKVSFAEGKFIGLQIVSPSQSDIVVIDQFFPQKDGAFSNSYKAQGPKWTQQGVYSIKLVYDEQVFEKQFNFKNPDLPGEELPSEEIAGEELNPSSGSGKILPESQTIPPNSAEQKLSIDPKFRVNGFPDPSKSPNYYFDRYFNEKEYQSWFESTFSDFSISEVVGYSPTHIEGFPDNENSAWYYVNRYNTEEQYRDWFDSQFPAKSIFEILGYPESLFQTVPNWIKNNAKWWSDGLISDSVFLNGIEFLVKEKIIYVTYTADFQSSTDQTIPPWVKDTAKWWAAGQIDENEFLKGITLLIENGIIIV